MLFNTKRILFTAILFCSSYCFAQKNSFFVTSQPQENKGFSLRKLSSNLSSGYGHWQWSNNLSNVKLYNSDPNHIYFGDVNATRTDTTFFTRNDSLITRIRTTTNQVGFNDWVQQPNSNSGGFPVSVQERHVFNSQVIYTNTTNNPLPASKSGLNLKYKGVGSSIPFNLSVIYDFNRLRLGVGGTFEFVKMFELTQNDTTGVVESYKFKGLFTSRKLWVYGGYTFFKTKKHAYTTDLQLGIFRFSKSFDRSAMRYAPVVNLGVTFQKSLSEYFRVFISPRFEFKSYNLSLTGIANVKHEIKNIYGIVGISYSIPSGKMCPIKSCKVRMMHVHGGTLFRGNPFHRWQNPRYGEEDPILVKYKRKNRRKLNPY